MNKFKFYIDILFKIYLKIKSGDSLLVSITNEDNELIKIIQEKAKEYKIGNLEFYFNNQDYKTNPVVDALNNNSKILIFVGQEIDDLNNDMSKYLLDNKVDGNYVIAPLPTKDWAKEVLNERCTTAYDIFKDYLYDIIGVSEENALVNANKKNNQIKNYASSINSLKLNKLFLEDVFGSNLSMDLNKRYVSLANSHVYPNYAVELNIMDNTLNGYIESIKPFYIGSNIVDDLQLFIKDGKVVDYDCSKGYKYISSLLNKSLNPVVSSIGLVDKTETTFNEYSFYNNIVLDRTCNPYLLINSYVDDENRQIMVPIGSKTLSIDGYDQFGKKHCIYKDNGFT